MHEAGLMQSALEMAADHARSAGATRIHRMRLRVGEDSGVVPEALAFAFRALSEGGPAEGAILEMEHVPGCGEGGDAGWVGDGGRCRRGTVLELVALEVS